MCAAPGLTVPALRSHQQLDENSPLGDLLGGVLDVPSCQIGECPEGQRRCHAGCGVCGLEGLWCLPPGAPVPVATERTAAVRACGVLGCWVWASPWSPAAA